MPVRRDATRRGSTADALRPGYSRRYRIAFPVQYGIIIILLLIIGAIALVFALVKLAKAAAQRERQRIAALADWAGRNGFAFAKGDPHNLDARLDGVFDIGRGHDRYAFEVLARAEPVPAFIFQYHYKTWETRTVTTTDSKGRTHTRTERYEQSHWKRFLILELGAAFPALVIRPEGWFDKVAGFVGFDDVDFESEEFSGRYFVKSSDRQFAYAVIHPQMMEWMLERRLALQLDRGMLLMDLSGTRHDAVTCHDACAGAVGFVNRIPSFVWQDYGKRPPVELTEPAAPVAPGPSRGRTRVDASAAAADDTRGEMGMMGRHG